MQLETQSVQVRQGDFFSPGLRLFILSFLFITALGIRLYRINDQFVEFHPTRQYRSAIIARGYFFESLKSLPEWKRQVASLNKDRQGMREPPILELLASLVYKIAGEEKVWIPRVLSSLFWLIGGVFLYLLTKRLASADAAILCIAFYLFVPFGIHASRSFQPDPLMVMGLLISLSAIVQYHNNRSRSWLVTAAAISAVAISIKFVSLFLILGAFLGLGIYTAGFRRFITSLRCVSFVLISALPATLFYSYGLLISGSLSEIARLDIMPHILITPSFWINWAMQVESLVGFAAVMGAFFGTIFFHDRAGRPLLIGLLSGYFVYGLIFSYTISTHDYWNLPIIPITALSLAPIATMIINRLGHVSRTWHSRIALSGILLLAVLFSAFKTRPTLITTTQDKMMMAASEIGRIVAHSTRTVFLAPHYGMPLLFYGELSGTYWPRKGIRAKYRRAGEQDLTVQQRLATIGFAPEYFIIADFKEFNNHHADLKEFLTGNCDLIAQSSRYQIYGACEQERSARTNPQ